MNTPVTAEQIGKFLSLATQRGATSQSFQLLLESGAAPLFLDPRAKFLDMPGLRRSLGLSGVYLEDIGKTIEFPGSGGFDLDERVRFGSVKFSYLAPAFLERFAGMRVDPVEPRYVRIAKAKQNVSKKKVFRETGDANCVISFAELYFLIENDLLDKGVPSAGCVFGETAYHHMHMRDKDGVLRTVTVYWNDGVRDFGDWALSLAEKSDAEATTSPMHDYVIY